VFAAASLAFWLVRASDSGGSALGVASAEPKNKVDLVVAATGFQQVTDIQFVPARERTAIVLQKEGQARLVTFGASPAEADKSPSVFDVAVRTASELGLLGLAFHPRWRDNGLFYVNYNPKQGRLRTRIAEWQLPPDRLGKEPARETRIILEVDQPYSNHDAGQLAFGPDGFLYVGLGDGGSAGDPHGHGQNLETLLGAMLRIDVNRRDGGREYANPPDNPFLGRKGARPEIWAYGLRNPWRYTFDPHGRLIVADVGQDEYEEVDLVERGKNYGWNRREGRHCYPPGERCTTAGLTDPIFEYDRDLGQSITGGVVYTGNAMPGLRGKYLLADFISGRVWALTLPPPGKPGATRSELLARFTRSLSCFGRDETGEVYAGDFTSGELLRFVNKR
jgi:glucose/arabinose dehydrogenase